MYNINFVFWLDDEIKWVTERDTARLMNGESVQCSL